MLGSDNRNITMVGLLKLSTLGYWKGGYMKVVEEGWRCGERGRGGGWRGGVVMVGPSLSRVRKVKWSKSQVG